MNSDVMTDVIIVMWDRAIILWWFARRKRATENQYLSPGNNERTRQNNERGNQNKQADLLDDNTTGLPPDGPRHANKTFPTPSNITEEMAYDLCREEIQGTDIYERCLNLTTVDTEHFVRSCVEDIKVTVFVFHNLTCSD